jgi:DNA topoisomerase-1
MDSINLEQAMELFKLPRTLGTTAEGESVVANVGRFGPYVKYGSKYVSLKEDDPYTVTLERALEVIRLKQEADANRIIHDFGTDNIQVLNGRYGPYVTDGSKNAKIPKDREPKALTLDECRTLLANAPARGRGRFGRGAAKRGAGARRSAPVAAPTPTEPAAAPARKAPAARVRATAPAAAAKTRARAPGKRAKSAKSAAKPARRTRSAQ